MDDLKQINLTESDIQSQAESKMEEQGMSPKKKTNPTKALLIIAIVLGLGTGFFVAQKRLLLAGDGNAFTEDTKDLTTDTKIKVGDVFGSADEKTFRDQAEGILMAGGIDGEGSHHIERGANKTQWVYVTSSVVDLDLVVGDRVSIWGETTQGKKAGWLMDVGRLKVLELDVAPAQEEGSAIDE